MPVAFPLCKGFLSATACNVGNNITTLAFIHTPNHQGEHTGAKANMLIITILIIKEANAAGVHPLASRCEN